MRTPYSKAYLDQLQFGERETVRVIEEIHALASAGKVISLAEEFFWASHLHVMHNADDGKFLDLYEFPGCTNYLFNFNYLTYHDNLNGVFPARDAFGEIPRAKREQDVHFLETQYREWSKILHDLKKQDSILQTLAKEAREHIEKSEQFSRMNLEGANMRASRKKSTALHSKYLYLKVKAFSQEIGSNELTLDLCGKKVVIDARAHYHILFRHYAKQAKPYQFDADYHTNQDFYPDDLPIRLAGILEEYAKAVPCEKFNDKILVEIKGVLYSIRFTPKTRKVGKDSEEILRLSSFFPVTKSAVIQQTVALSRFPSSSDVVFLA